MNTKQKINNIFYNTFCLEKEYIKPSTDIFRDLKFNPAIEMELVEVLEKTFEIRIKDKEWDFETLTIQEINNFINSKLKK